MAKRSALGRGLSALIDDADKVKEQISGIAEIELTNIEANPFQPRTSFNDESLEELAVSIKEVGLIQPVTLRKIGENKYQIIAGERRFRAAQLAGLVKIPAFIREVDNDSMLEMALVENIQREDLNPIEIGVSYQRLIEECDLTQETLSARLGKKRSTVANYLRLLKLPAIIQKGLIDKEISMGHARPLINVEGTETQLMIFEQIKKHDLSVRKVEEIVYNLSAENHENEENAQKNSAQKYRQLFQPLKKKLDNLFESPVKMTTDNKGKGKIIIPFKTQDELKEIVEILDSLK
ncbi:MAG: ParB/RepB/Spo0J family partition protein [Prolixibacteraceae bacterium]|nr:ParB/RepB/Spo0J family partition protein [Prolixibacteraceae bacterium]